MPNSNIPLKFSEISKFVKLRDGGVRVYLFIGNSNLRKLFNLIISALTSLNTYSVYPIRIHKLNTYTIMQNIFTILYETDPSMHISTL